MKKVLSKKQIEKLDILAHKHGCSLYLPPCLGRTNPFFNLSVIHCNNPLVSKIMSAVSKVGYSYKLHSIKGKKIMDLDFKKE